MTQMLGYDAAPMPYELGHFTYAGWGTKLQVNMGEVAERIVTLSLIHIWHPEDASQ